MTHPASPVTYSNVRVWLFQIAHNAALDLQRRRKRQEATQSVET